MKLFGNRKRQSREKREPAAEPQKAAADQKKTEQQPAPGNQGKGFLTMSIIALAGVILMCVLLIRHSAAAKMPIYLTPETKNSSSQQTDSFQTEESSEEPQEVPVEELSSTYDSRRINFLVAGVNEELLTNTLLLAGIDLESGELSYVSVPRETYISGNYDIPMLNQVYAAAGGGERGAAALKEKFKEMFGFWVDYYLILDAEALEKAVDLAGGVEFDVPAELDYSEAVLAAGKQTLAGGQAVGLFRFRDDYDEVNTDCTQVQRDFIAAFLEQALTNRTAEEFNADLETLLPLLDTDLTLGNLNWLAQFLTEVDFDEMYHKTLLGEEITDNGSDCYEVDLEDTLNVINIHFNPTGKDLTEYDMNIRQKTGNASDGTIGTYWWQNVDSSSEEPTESDPTESSDSSDATDSSDTQTDAPTDAPTDTPTETPSETDAPPEE